MLSEKLEATARAIGILGSAGPIDPMLQRQIARTLLALAQEAEALENAVVPARCRGPLPEGVVSIAERRRGGGAAPSNGGDAA
jgi:hypothetical protein